MWENESIIKRSIKPPGIPYPIQSHIRMNIFLTVIYTFPKVLIRRICLTIKTFFSLWSFFHSPNLNVWLRRDTVRRKWMLVTLRVKMWNELTRIFIFTYAEKNTYLAYAFSNKAHQNSFFSLECMNTSFFLYVGRRSSMITSSQCPSCQILNWKAPQ